MPTNPIARETVFEGVRFDVVRIGYPRRGGGTMQREVVVPHDAVVILAVVHGDRDEEKDAARHPLNEMILLIRNERPAVGQTLWELPAGTMEDGEDPATSAGRELIEETGHRAERLMLLGAFYSSPGFCTEKLHAFLAQGLTHVGQHLDDTERIEVHPTPMNEALEMIRDGRIQDAKTIAALLHYHTFTGFEIRRDLKFQI